jgi:hypothetical protein
VVGSSWCARPADVGWVSLWGGGRCAGELVGNGSMGWWPACSFSVLWGGEAFHGLGVQGAEVSALPSALPKPSVSPASQQGP